MGRNHLRYLSVCSGIEAATVAWHPLGWTPVAFSEIEPFPSAVLAHHYPAIQNVGDMTKFQDWRFNESVELLVGGTPCQSFSVAGLRKGMADPRGNLALVYLGLADKFRPRWIVWENVPGVLSSNGGRDFGSFLGALAELGYGFAYRVLDAQWFGVAQRRRRVFVVGHLGDWRRAAAVLFERESLRRDTAPSREKGQIAPTIPSRSTAGGGLGTDFDCDGGLQPYSVANCLTRRMYKGVNSDCNEGQTPVLRPVYEMHGQDSRVRDVGEICTTVTSKYGTGGGNVPVTVQPVAVDVYNQAIDGQTAATLTEACGGTNTSGPKVMQPVGFTRCDHGGDAVVDGTPTMRCGSNYSAHLAVAQPIAFKETADCLTSAYGTKWNGNASATNGGLFAAHPVGFDAYNNDVTGEVSKTIDTGQDYHYVPNLLQNMAVRRLTPCECERLQGFNDNYTNIPWRKKDEAPDGPRYKALGNSMAVPVMAWIGKRIAMVEGIPANDNTPPAANDNREKK
jgi:DNA (cytosine-5)-methyltransferase 1